MRTHTFPVYRACVFYLFIYLFFSHLWARLHGEVTGSGRSGRSFCVFTAVDDNNHGVSLFFRGNSSYRL